MREGISISINTFSGSRYHDSKSSYYHIRKCIDVNGNAFSDK